MRPRRRFMVAPTHCTCMPLIRAKPYPTWPDNDRLGATFDAVSQNASAPSYRDRLLLSTPASYVSRCVVNCHYVFDGEAHWFYFAAMIGWDPALHPGRILRRECFRCRLVGADLLCLCERHGGAQRVCRQGPEPHDGRLVPIS